jgi:spore maturation protein A
MSKIWIVIMISSLIMTSFSCPGSIVSTMMTSAKTGVTMAVEFIGIYAVWLGFMQVLDDCKLSHKLSSILSRPARKLFGNVDSETEKNICLNIASNIIGIGSAATPYGIKAMKGLDKGEDKATKAMIMLVVINSTGIQLLPTTVIGMRAMAGSVSPSCVLWPTIVVTFLPTILGVLLVLTLCKKRQKHG